MTRPELRRSGPHMAVAFAAMGGWALVANRAAPWPDMLLAGAIQGLLSAGLTLAMKRLTEAVVGALRGRAAVVAAPVACGLVSVAVLTSIHAAAGTPRILATILVPLAVSSAYAAAYALALTTPDRSRPHG